MLDPGETTAAATDATRVWARVRRYMGPEDAELIRGVGDLLWQIRLRRDAALDDLCAVRLDVRRCV